MSRHRTMLERAAREKTMFGFPPAMDSRFGPAFAPANGHDQWQQLAHQLFLSSGPDARGSVGLASATAGEGTSYVAFHLAAELARSSWGRTLLLEANAHRPCQSERCGLPPDPGLRQLLDDKRFSLDDCLRETAVEQLWLLPAGSGLDGGGQSPDWAGFRELFAELRGRFAAIVVDLPPVNLSTDFLILGPLVDELVLVVQAGCCGREVIQNALARLRRANPNVRGTVLNRRKFVIPAPVYRRL